MSVEARKDSYTSPYKILVGIDYGTTFSGISFVTTNKTADDIVVVSRWPNHRDNTWKAPTTVAYPSENPKLGRTVWGFEVTRGLSQFVWTKLLLDNEVDLTRYDDPLLKEMYGSGFLRLPPKKSAKDVAQDFLRELYKYTVETLERELSPAVFNAMPMECWVTMPAIWSDKAQSDTRAAALGAGFGSRPSDTVNMISEPEAAALWALRPYLGPRAIDPLKPGEHVLVCDCGGGTVDLVTYEILETEPMLQHKEKCRGTGAKCGSTSVDRQFVQWMGKTFGEAYTSLDMKKRGPGSLFMTSFESVKKNFGERDSDRSRYEVGPIDLSDILALKYDEDEQTVVLSHSDMISFFEPAVKELIKLIEGQVAQLKTSGAVVDRFVLVGGFGDSPYLNRILKDWCKKNGIRRFTCPTDCQAAIVKGAALRGLANIRPSTIIAKRHYGWCWSMDFREGIDDEANACLDEFDNRKRCRGRMHWAVKKGQQLDETFKTTQSVVWSTSNTKSLLTTLELYSCLLDKAPERVEALGVRREGVIKTKFSSIKEAAKEAYNPRLSAKVYQFGHTVETDFRSELGILSFKSFSNGQVACTTTITFDG